MSEWRAWPGRKVLQEDRLDEAFARRWCATFDVLVPANGRMPQGIHLCLCTPEAATAMLGEDGHPARDERPDGFLPPVPLPRRMWASSSIAFHAPIRIGTRIERTSRIEAVRDKQGTSGRLVFVDIVHVTTADHVEAVSETQTLVYREAAPADAPLSPPDTEAHPFDHSGWDAHRVLTPDARLLFRYSALSFNSHRIHYDLAYARDVERYRGLVVHGPLTASLLLQLAGAQFGDNRLASFAFRGLSPAIAGEPLHLVMRGAGDCIEMAAFADDGRQVAEAAAVLR